MMAITIFIARTIPLCFASSHRRSLAVRPGNPPVVVPSGRVFSGRGCAMDWRSGSASPLHNQGPCQL